MKPLRLLSLGMLAAATLMQMPMPLHAQAQAQGFPVSDNGNGTFSNPVMWADVPDLCVIRVDKTYYMVSTTMHMAPGIPVMRSYDLVNWEIINYCYPRLEDADAQSLKNGKNDYASGSWASNIRYDTKLKRFFVITACQSTGKSYFFSTADIEKGPWHLNVVDKCYDPGLLMADSPTGYQRYVLYGQQNQHYREILVDPTTFDITLGPEKLWKETCDHEQKKGVWVEGAQSIKIGDYIYLFMIALRDKRTQIVWRGKDINDPASWEARRVFYGNMRDKEGREVMPSSGIAQGAIVDTPDGKWYALLFQDYGSVGRTPILLPVRWTDDKWPIIGNDGTSTDQTLPVPAATQKLKQPLRTNIVVSDEFDNDARRLIISDHEVGTDITAGIPVDRLNELASATATPQEPLLQNGGFESDVESWTIQGGDLGRLSIEREANGNHVAKISERKGTVAGPLQKIDGKLQPGTTYRVSARVKYDDYTDAFGKAITVIPERDFKITVNIGGQFGEVALQKIPKGKWTTLQGSYTVRADAKVEDAVLFVETTWAPVGDLSAEVNSREHTFDFLVDDISLAADPIADAIAANENGYNGSNLRLQWQWNHNPNNNLWSLTDRKGWLRLKSGLLSTNIRNARNTLTQRTFGPASSGTTALDVSRMMNGDVAGISAFQNQYGFVGVQMEAGQKHLIMQRAQKKDDAAGKVIESIPLKQDTIYLKVDCDFGADKKDKAHFYYSLDNKTWTRIGDTLQMVYDWPDFTGYRFALFYYSKEQLGGCIDFDYFHISDKMEEQK